MFWIIVFPKIVYLTLQTNSRVFTAIACSSDMKWSVACGAMEHMNIDKACMTKYRLFHRAFPVTIGDDNPVDEIVVGVACLVMSERLLDRCMYVDRCIACTWHEVSHFMLRNQHVRFYILNSDLAGPVRLVTQSGDEYMHILCIIECSRLWRIDAELDIL